MATVTIENEKYVARVTDGVLTVHDVAPPKVAVTTNGVTVVSPLPQGLEFLGKDPLFAATYTGIDSNDVAYAEIDVRAGFSRWHGAKTVREVRGALVKCGFEAQERTLLINAMKEEEKDCPYYR